MASLGRRDRALAGAQRVLVESLAEKVLHGWLQNRHQTLFPLTVNLRSLSAEQTGCLVQWLAVCLLATLEEDGARVAAAVWLHSVGGDAAAGAALEAALAAPPPLHAALAGVVRHGLAAYAYIVARVATNPHDPACAAFLDYVAIRLALPATVVRSATRRYRR